MIDNDGWTKSLFQKAWGKDGYVENFSFGIGIDKVCELSMYPFLRGNTLEIGSGGGSFTNKLVSRCVNLTAIDVIKKPVLFNQWSNLNYIELENKDFKL